jgi:citrate lyase subunit beta/citryl-CoA lyase
MGDIHSLPFRSVLYLPAINQRAIEKARGLPADAVIFDLEDAVAPNEKEAARQNLLQAFSGGPVARGLNVIRVNGLDQEDFARDLAVARLCRPDAVLVPKVSTRDDVWTAGERLGMELPLWCMIETAAGIDNVSSIASCKDGSGNPTSQCLVIGTNDIMRETGVSLQPERAFMQSWLMAVVLAAKANGLRVVDGVWNDFRNEEGFAQEATQGRLMGFDGKTLIHPGQIEPANRIFSPSPEALAEACAIVEAFDDPVNEGKGVINLNGRMVERLHLAMAQSLLARHALMAGLTVNP